MAIFVVFEKKLKNYIIMNLEMRKKMKVDYFIQELIEILNEAQVEVEADVLTNI